MEGTLEGVEVLDIDTSIQKRDYESVVRWWESKRLVYNAFVGGAGVLGLLIGGSGGVSIGLTIIGALFYAVIINTCYTASWIIEILNLYYFKGIFPLKALRKVIFTLGTIGSTALTFILALGTASMMH